MPVRIPVYQQQTAPNDKVSSPQAQGLAVSNADAQGLSAVSQGLGSVAEGVTVLQDRDNLNAIQSERVRVSDFEVNITNWLEQAKQEAPAGASGFTTAALGKFDEVATKHIESIGNQKAKEYVQLRVAELKKAVFAQAKDFELKEGVKNSVAQTDKILDNARVLVQKTPSEGIVSYMMEQYKEAVNSNRFLRPEAKEAAIRIGNSKLASEYINKLLTIDPSKAKEAYQSYLNNKTLTADDAVELDKVITPAEVTHRGINIGRDIFKSNTDGNLETMINLVKDQKLDPKTEGFAIAEVTSSYKIREEAIKQQADNAKKKVNDILVEKALSRGGDGINYISDLTAQDWAVLQRDNPEYASALQDKIRREAQEIERADRALKIEQRKMTLAERADKRYEDQEKKNSQTERESELLIVDDINKVDLKEELATGRINATGYRRLSKIQETANPLNNEAVKYVLRKIDSGSSLAKAIKVKDKNAEASWKMKYREAVLAFTYNNAGAPDFDAKLTEFADKYIFSDLVTDIFKTRDAEREQKYKKAIEAAGGIPQKGNSIAGAKKTTTTEQAQSTMNTLPPATQHKGKTVRDTETGKRLRSDGVNWVEVR